MQKELANVMTVTYIIKFIDSIRFIASSLSNLVDNFAGGLHKSKCNDCKSCLEYLKEGLLVFSYSTWNYEKEFDKDLAKIFENTYKFCDGYINKLDLTLQRIVYLYEYMDDWTNFNEISFSERTESYSSYKPAKKVWIHYEIKSEYHVSIMIRTC